MLVQCLNPSLCVVNLMTLLCGVTLIDFTVVEFLFKAGFLLRGEDARDLKLSI